tara:strand:- start:175 stop:345 length:171 start_codon:yes stop_codon:yes gene_type:complete
MIELISIVINLITGIYILFVMPMRLNKIKKGVAAGLKDNKKIYDLIRGVGNETKNK